MALTDESNGTGMYMPVAPIGGYYGGNQGGMGFGGDWFAWLILAMLLGGGWGMGGFGGGWGGMMGMGFDFPWLLTGQQNISNNTNDGFRDQMLQTTISSVGDKVTSGFGDVALGIAGINQNICQTGNSVVSAVTGAQGAISQQMYSNELASLNRSFAEQTANTAGFNGVQSSLCDIRYGNAANTRDIIESQNRGTQAVLDKLCQLELDGYKREADSLRAQLSDAKLAASQTAQNAFISQGFANEVDALYNRLNSCPVPTTPVYGRTPIFTCNSQPGCGCGCGGNVGFAN